MSENVARKKGKMLEQCSGGCACGYPGLGEPGWSGRGPWGALGHSWGLLGPKKAGFSGFRGGLCVCVCVPLCVCVILTDMAALAALFGIPIPASQRIQDQKHVA